MICPNCSAGEISPLTHRCELCGFVPEGVVAVEAPRAEVVEEVARVELAERFRFDEFLGRGEATAVFLAREQGSSRQIVVKVLPRPADRRPDQDDRFRRAVQSVAALEHPHIVPVFEHGWTDHLYWYAMEHVRGRSLRDYLLQRGKMDLKACLRVVAQVASALDHAHRRGIVHGALKPSDVLIDADGWVHVSDLLVRRALQPAPPPAPLPPPPGTGAAEAKAPPARPTRPRNPHTAPEDLVTPASDQYALAVLVTECLEGVPRGEADAAAPPSPTLAEVPAHVRHAIQRALSARPMDRFASVLDFVAALETYAPAAGSQPSGRSSSVVLRQTDWTPPDRPVPWRLLAVGALVAMAAGAGVWQSSNLGLLVQRLFGRGPAAAIEPPASDSVAAAAAARQGPGAPAPRAPAGSTSVARRPAPSLPPATVARSQAPARRPGAATPARAQPQPAAAPAPSAQQPAAAPAEQPAAPAAPAEPGHLFVSATPWGRLYVDGQLVGETPKADLAVTPGAHTVRIVREGFVPFERSLQVSSGQVIRLTGIVLQSNNP